MAGPHTANRILTWIPQGKRLRVGHWGTEKRTIQEKVKNARKRYPDSRKSGLAEEHLLMPCAPSRVQKTDDD